VSLLLEALKKAEKAKEEAQRRHSGGNTLTLEPALEARPADARPAEERRVLTRDELPSISTPLEIASDDLKPRAAADPQAAERASARNVFEAKVRERNPRMPFFITLGVLGAFALCTVIYFWYQLRPPYPLVVQNLPPPPPPASPIQVPVTSAPAPSSQIPGLPGNAPEVKTTSVASKTPAIPRPAPLPRPQQVAVAPVEKPTLPARVVEVSRAAPGVHPKVESGYAAFLAGDLARARADYAQALRDEPGNRDALLGAAAVDVRSGSFEPAEAAYLRLLQADPRDPHAQAGLIALRSARIDPVSAESRVKNMLAADPAAHVLNFTLGNQLAQQGRWAEAQQQYFKAFAADPDNADFAYNLAVSLDHLRQQRLALEYYQRAIALAEKRGASFSLEDARSRAQKLAN
jgi:tetratricopeptide (TPR) repeat protein